MTDSTKLIGGVFDATQVEPAGGSAQLPVGKYPVIITGGRIKATKDETGGLAELDLRVTEGPHTGKSGNYRLNLWNKSEQAAEIARKQLSALCHVIGRFKIDDLAMLFNVPFVVEVDYQDKSDKYTEVKRVLDMAGNLPGQSGAVAPAPVAQAAPAAAAGWGGAPAAAAPAAAPAAGWGNLVAGAPAASAAIPAGWARPAG